MPTCQRCNKTKRDANRYYAHTTCKACYMKVWRKQNPAASKAIEGRRYSAARTAQWRTKNPERWKALLKSHYEKNKPRFYARNAKRKADKLLRTPKWLTKEQRDQITHFYDTAPPGYHVDHIVPLRGKTVSGLHVPWNLQHLSALENNRKNNKF